MFPTTSLPTSSAISNLKQSVSTGFVTVTKTATTTATITATEIIRKTAYTTSTVTASATAKYTATHLRDIVPPSLLENATAAYTVVNQKDAAAEHYAIQCVLALALTAGAALAWRIGKTPPPQAPHGIDRFKWVAMKHHVHTWLHKKLRSDAGLYRELEDAKRKLQEHEALRKAKSDHQTQTEDLSGVSQVARNETLQEEMELDHVPDEVASLRKELTTTRDQATELRHVLKETTHALGSTIALVRDLQERTVEPALPSTEFDFAAFPATPAAEELKAQLQTARQEAEDANAKAVSSENRLEEAHQKVKAAESELYKVKDLVRTVQEEAESAKADVTSLNMQLQVSRQEEEKAKIELSSMERTFGEARLKHNRELGEADEQVLSLKEQVEQWEHIAAEAKKVNDEIQTTLNDENEYLQKKLDNETARGEALEKELEKLKSEIEKAKATELAAPPLKSSTSSETQTSPVIASSSNSPSLGPNHPPNVHTRILSVAGVTVPSTPRPAVLQATPTMPLSTSTSTTDNTPDRIALTHMYNAEKIELSAYLKGMKALTGKTNKRKSDGTEETPRPVKKLPLGEERAYRPIATVLTPGGGPAFKLPKHGLGEEADDSVVFDEDETLELLGADESTNSTTGVENANLSAPSEQEAEEADEDFEIDVLLNDGDSNVESLDGERSRTLNEAVPQLITDDVAVELTPATKRKISIDDNEGSAKPYQMLRTQENLGEEQTPTLSEMTPTSIIDASGPAADIFSSGSTPGLKLPAQGLATPENVNIVIDANEAAELNNADSSALSDQGAVKTETDTLGDTLMDDSDNSHEAAATVENKDAPSGFAHNARAQAGRRKSRLPKPVPTSTRKSSRNAGKPARSLNENLLSKFSASRQRFSEAQVASPAKPAAKPRASRSPSKAKKTK